MTSVGRISLTLKQKKLSGVIWAIEFTIEIKCHWKYQRPDTDSWSKCVKMQPTRPKCNRIWSNCSPIRPNLVNHYHRRNHYHRHHDHWFWIFVSLPPWKPFQLPQKPFNEAKNDSKFFVQGQVKWFSGWRRYKYPKSIAKLNLSYQVLAHRSFTLKIKRT